MPPKESTRQRIADEQALKDAFAASAANALDANSQRLMQLSQQQLESQQRQVTNKLNEKETAIETLLRPMQESLARLATQSQELELKREGAYSAVLAEVQNIQRSHTDLRKETTQLVAALRAPKARGNWGELQLKKCVEFAGMVQYAPFDVERFVRGEDASYRPDLVVKMPNGRTIIVDAKTPLDAFLDACERGGRGGAHGQAGGPRGTRAGTLEGPVEQRILAAVCRLAGLRGLLSAQRSAVQRGTGAGPSLIEFSASSGVLLATPTTLIALLKAVAFGWQQSEIALNADKIRDTALSVYGKLAGLAQGLRRSGQAVDGCGQRV